jgi:selenoprotein W-related protein
VTGPLKVRITYCAECGYEPQTLDLAGRLMREFGDRLSSIEIIPWAEGTFDVRVEDHLVHSMARDGGFPEYEKVRAAVRAAIERGASTTSR